MFRPEWAYLALGRPVVSVEALAALRDLLDTLRAQPQSDMHSLDQSSPEGVNEAASDAAQRHFGSQGTHKHSSG